MVAANTIFVVKNIGDTTVHEYKCDMGENGRKLVADFGDTDIITGYIQVPKKYKNKRRYLSVVKSEEFMD